LENKKDKGKLFSQKRPFS
jgi:metal-dependent amidase/aminoacylase/carboxypeptidase family protein